MRFTGIVSVFLTYLLLCLLTPCSVSADIKEASQIEVEDRDFIHHLLKDKYYVYAKEEAEEYLEKYPEGIFRAEVRFALAQIAVVNKSLEKALSHYTTILTKYPDSSFIEDSLYWSGILHLKLNQNQPGRKKLRLLIKKYPQSRFLFRTYLKLGELAFKENNWKTAEVYLETTVKNGDLKPDLQLEAENYLAWTYYFQKKEKEAYRLFITLLKSDLSTDQKTKIAYQLAVDAQRKEKYSKAIYWHERVLKEWPHPEFSDRSRFWIAESLFLMNQNSKKPISEADKRRAIKLYTLNLKLTTPVEPENSHYHRGWFLLDLGQADKAERDFSWLQRRNKKYGKNVELTIIRARYHESRNNWQKANKILRAALKLQDDNQSKNRLLEGIIRTDYQQKKCLRVIQEYESLTLLHHQSAADEILFYAGTCYHHQEQMKKAEQVLRKIPISSRYAVLSFDYFMDTLRKNRRQQSGLDYLEKVMNQPQFDNKEKILLYKTEFQLDLELWFAALKTMKAIVGITPDKKKDPWFLLNVARTLDQVVISMQNQNWRSQRPQLKSESYYKQQAIIYYREAYKHMPLEQEAVRLSILEILIKHHESKKAFKTLVYQYNTAITLSRDEYQKDRFAYRLSNIMLKLGEDTEKVIPILRTIHCRANREVNYKASALLAELYISKKDFQAAIETLIDLAQQPIDETPWYSRIHFRLGELYQAEEEWLAAINHYSKVVQSKQLENQKKEARLRIVNIQKFLQQLETTKQNKGKKAE